MVVAARIEWVRAQIMGGMHVRLSMAPAANATKIEIKIIVDPARQVGDAACKHMLLQTLDDMAALMETRIVVDRGHKHHRTGLSEIALWVSHLSSAAANSTETDSGDDGLDGDGNNGPDDSMPPDHKRLKTDRRIDRGSDPWHSGCQDPCAMGHQNGSDPRQHQHSHKIVNDTRTLHPLDSMRDGEVGCSVSKNIDTLSVRLDRIECLLMLSDQEHFRKIDGLIQSALDDGIHSGFEPESEQSPEKPTLHQNGVAERPAKCLEFYIGEAVTEEEVTAVCSASFFEKSNTPCSDAECQTSPLELCFTAEASCQTEQLYTAQETVAVADVLASNLGYADKPLSHAELQGKAQFLLEHGWKARDIESVSCKMQDSLDVVTAGDILKRLDGPCWRIRGFDGSSMLTASDRVKVMEYNMQLAVAKVRDCDTHPRKRNGEAIYGKIELVNYIFTIQDSP